MDLILSGLTWDICLVYVDDVIVFSRTLDEHMKRLDMVFQRIHEAKLKIKYQKCKFLQSEVRFLGFIINSNGIETDKQKTDAIRNWRRPCNVKQLRSFLGTCSYYRKFVNKFSCIAAPLFALTKKGQKFIWSETAEQAFATLKEKLCSTPILALPRDDAQTILDVDASDMGVAAVLSQIQDNEEKVLAYASRVYNDAEKNYCISRRELLGLIYGLTQFRQYLLGRHIIVRTDHAPLLALTRSTKPSSQMCRWQDIIQDYNLEIQHRPGLRHGNADGLSRSICKQCNLSSDMYADIDSSIVAANSNVHAYRLRAKDQVNSQTPNGLQDIAKLQELDPHIGPIYKALCNKQTEAPEWTDHLSSSADTKNYIKLWPFLTVQNNIVYRKWLDDDRQVKWLQLLVPEALREEVLQKAHTGATGGHNRIKKTLAQLKRRAYWTGWRQDCVNFCRRCSRCAQYHRGKLQRQAELQDMTVGAPMERAGIDLTGPHPKASNKVYILTFIDYYTRWAEAVALPNKEAHTVAKALVDNVFTRLGCVSHLISDQGKEFDNELMIRLCELLDIDKSRTTAYKPSSNGVCERLHKSLNNMIGKMIDENQKNWPDLLPIVMAAYRSAPHESTSYSPNFLMFGREVLAPIDLWLETPSEEETNLNVDDYVYEVRNRLKYAHELVRTHLSVQAKRTKKYYDLKVKPRAYNIGDWVWMFSPRRKVGKYVKWQRQFSGPFLVVDVLGPVTYAIQKSMKAQTLIVHTDKLKPFLGDAPRSWLTVYQHSEQPTCLKDMDSLSSTADVVVDQLVSDERPLDTVDKSPETTEMFPSDVDMPEQTHERPRRQRRTPNYLADYVQQ